MGIDHDWVAIRQVVVDGLRDAAILEPPPASAEEDLGDIADTVADHLCAALRSGVLVKRARWWRRRAPADKVAER